MNTLISNIGNDGIEQVTFLLNAIKNTVDVKTLLNKPVTLPSGQTVTINSIRSLPEGATNVLITSNLNLAGIERIYNHNVYIPSGNLNFANGFITILEKLPNLTPAFKTIATKSFNVTQTDTDTVLTRYSIQDQITGKLQHVVDAGIKDGKFNAGNVVNVDKNCKYDSKDKTEYQEIKERLDLIEKRMKKLRKH